MSATIGRLDRQRPTHQNLTFNPSGSCRMDVKGVRRGIPDSGIHAEPFARTRD